MNTPLRTALGLAAAVLLTPLAQAVEYGSVVSSTPVLTDIAVPQRQCYDEQVAVPGYTATTGAGALVGAIVGGVVGNSVGAGFGRAAATGLGVVAGAAVGDRVEAQGQPVPAATTQTVRRCQTVSQHEQRVIGYDVVYDYHGQRYSTRTARDPGQRIALNVAVTPVDAAALPAPAVPPAVYAPPAPAYAAPVYAPPVYAPPVYAAPPMVYGPPSIYIAPTLWFGGSWGGHRHWR